MPHGSVVTVWKVSDEAPFLSLEHQVRAAEAPISHALGQDNETASELCRLNGILRVY